MRIVGHQRVLVSVAGSAVECCDHENGAWVPVDTLQSPQGHIIPGLTEGHTYSFRLSGGNPLPAITIPHESRWQQEQFERRYQELHTIGKYCFSTGKKWKLILEVFGISDYVYPFNSVNQMFMI